MENEKFQELALDHLDRLTQDNAGITQNMQTFKEQLGKVESAVIRIENDHGAKLQALFDAREAQNDINQRIFETLDRIEGKVDHLTLKISAHEAILKKVK